MASLDDRKGPVGGTGLHWASKDSYSGCDGGVVELMHLTNWRARSQPGKAWQTGCGGSSQTPPQPSQSYPIRISALNPVLSPLFSLSSLFLSSVCATQHNMSARAGLRFFSQTSRQSTIRAPFRSQNTFRRHNTTAAQPTVEIPTPVKQNIFQRLWTSEVGVKTVHFWWAGPLPKHASRDCEERCTTAMRV